LHAVIKDIKLRNILINSKSQILLMLVRSNSLL
jgi:hypothetical protein